MQKLFLFLGLIALNFTLFGVERVVSLSPNITEMIFAIGAGEKLVGKSTACNYPESGVKNIPDVGNYAEIFAEKLLSVEPEIIFSESFFRPADRAFFKEFKLEFIELPAKSFADYFNNLRILGDKLNCQKQAQELIEANRKVLENSGGKVNSNSPQVLLLLGDSPLVTCGKKSYLTEFIAKAGGVNIARNIDKDYFIVSAEWVAQQKVDILIVPFMSGGSLKKLEESLIFSELDAIKNRRIWSDFDPDLLCRLGPRCFDGIVLLRNFINKK